MHLIFIICFLASTIVASQIPPNLGNPPYFSPNYGKAVDVRDRWGEDLCTHHLYIAAGHSGVVFRIVRPLAEPFCRKYYGDRKVAEFDFWLMQIYRRAYEEEVDLGVLVPRTRIVLNGDRAAIDSDSVFGTDLLTLLKRKDALSTYLLNKYEKTFPKLVGFWESKYRARAHSALESQYRNNDFAQFPFRVLKFERTIQDSESTTYTTETIILKADMIVVNPMTLEFYLVDPN